LGDVFGPGCGTNDDLNESGATTWLESIPNSACSAVNYYTSFFNDNWWSYDYCHLTTDAFLSDPEDGTVEKAKVTEVREMEKEKQNNSLQPLQDFSVLLLLFGT
jgi:hypothetical protein